MCVKKLREGSNRTWRPRQINLVQVNIEAHEENKCSKMVIIDKSYEWFNDCSYMCYI
jgi:hypothetical protein